MDLSAPITLTIIVLTVLTSIRGFYNPPLVKQLLFNPYMVTEKNEFHRLFTMGFVHADWFHLGFNMYVLWNFGRALEAYDQFLGHLGFFTMYIVALPISALPSLIRASGNIHYNSLGASGAVSAIVFSFIMFAPRTKLSLLFIPVEFEAWIFGAIYLVYSFYMTFRPNPGNDRINHDAHLWGAISGVLMTLVMKPQVASDFLSQF